MVSWALAGGRNAWRHFAARGGDGTDADVALAPGRLARQASIVAEAAQLERTQLLQWTLAFTGLSAAWIIGDGDDPALDLGVAALAAAELSLLSNSRVPGHQGRAARSQRPLDCWVVRQ